MTRLPNALAPHLYLCVLLEVLDVVDPYRAIHTQLHSSSIGLSLTVSARTVRYLPPPMNVRQNFKLMAFTNCAPSNSSTGYSSTGSAVECRSVNSVYTEWVPFVLRQPAAIVIEIFKATRSASYPPPPLKGRLRATRFLEDGQNSNSTEAGILTRDEICAEFKVKLSESNILNK